MQFRTGTQSPDDPRNRRVARTLGAVALAVPLAAVVAGLGSVAVLLGLVVAAGCLASAVVVARDDDYDVAPTRE